ncbi:MULTISPECIES: aminotransferase class IV [Tenacibaculum]|uniref:aminotransferase class IV n=1 Tax=Tenacibaculum TaxID=104267 RepID=UPI000896F35E|nr:MULTISPECIES: aminotransferase class IV [unclassified Tenacibaculum]RBW62963.1 aminotransferase class IV [Tenacibaculum sp. E3R01]SEE66369.1 branched-chain amino acid aminotransferase [Tenacibaculum sp. MAR_2010_89]
MVNFNGTIISPKELQISHENRAFKYGDGVFETIKVENNRVIFFEDHYFRLMASMRMLRMKIPMEFTLEFLQDEILKTVKENITQNTSSRVKLTVFRKDGGLYTPKTNEIDYLIDVKPISLEEKDSYTIDLYKDFYNYSGLLSTVKTTNRMVNTLASIFAKENDFDNCILLNERKGVVEVTNGNIFIVKGNTIKTPALTEGCIKGVIRKKIIEIVTKHPDFTIEETTISPFEIQKADEVFITNAIVGITSVTNYRKKTFDNSIAQKLKNSLKVTSLTMS